MCSTPRRSMRLAPEKSLQAWTTPNHKKYVPKHMPTHASARLCLGLPQRHAATGLRLRRSSGRCCTPRPDAPAASLAAESPARTALTLFEDIKGLGDDVQNREPGRGMGRPFTKSEGSWRRGAPHLPARQALAAQHYAAAVHVCKRPP